MRRQPVRLAVGIAALAAACTSYTGTEAPSDENLDAEAGASSGRGDASSSSSGATETDAGKRTDAAGEPEPVEPVEPVVLTTEEKAMLDFVNATRAATTDASPPLNPVTRDDIATRALREWVGCTDARPSAGTGSTLLFGTANGTATPEGLMQELADYRAFYTRATNTCGAPSPTMCQAYTNMVQRSVSRVACVWGETCTGPAPRGEPASGPWRSWACQFAPLPEPTVVPF